MKPRVRPRPAAFWRAASAWSLALLALLGLGLALRAAHTARAVAPESHWEALLDETFAAGLGPGWMALDLRALGAPQLTWATASFTHTSAPTSVWAVGGGAQGSALVAGVDPYPADVASWLLYGPLDLTPYARARLTFDWWLDSARGDTFGWCVLPQLPALTAEALEAACTGPQFSGRLGAWIHTDLPLDAYTGEDGAAALHLAFRFSSNGDDQRGLGAFLDSVQVWVPRTFQVYLPLVAKPEPLPTWVPYPVITNPGFETPWEQGGTHHAIIFHTDGRVEPVDDRDSVRTPPGWVTWFREGAPLVYDPANPDGYSWSQPETNLVEAWIYDYRVRSGALAQRLFSFYKMHDAGFLQQAAVTPGTRLRLSAWAHAWSNLGEASAGPVESDPHWSEGSHVGYNHFFALEGTPGLDSADRNFTFWVGIDPTGGTNPYASTVVWGQGAHIYNAYFQVPHAEAVAQSSTVTLFLRSRTMWPFKHNDAHWDDVLLERAQ